MVPKLRPMHHKRIKWPGFTVNNALIISLDKHAFEIKSNPIKFAGKAFKPKSEAHITVLGSDLGTQLQQQIKENPQIEQRIRTAFENTDWSYSQTRDRRHLVRETTGFSGSDKTEESIIMLIKMEAMAEFYTKLKLLEIIDKDHPVPPPHVTLYTRNCDLGIGVHSERELSILSREQIDTLE